MNHGKNVGFNFFQVRCAHKSGDVINFIIAECRIYSWLKWYKNYYKNRLSLAKVIVKNKVSRFFYGSLCIRTWLVFAGDTPDVQIWILYIMAFESYPLMYIHQTDRHNRNYKSCCFAGGQKCISVQLCLWGRNLSAAAAHGHVLSLPSGLSQMYSLCSRLPLFCFDPLQFALKKVRSVSFWLLLSWYWMRPQLGNVDSSWAL